MNATIRDDLIAWKHGNGWCKLILVPRNEIDKDSDEPDAWDLVWIEESTNLRRFDVRLDSAYGRMAGLDRRDQEQITEYLETAPEEATEVLREWTS